MIISSQLNKLVYLIFIYKTLDHLFCEIIYNFKNYRYSLIGQLIDLLDQKKF